MNAKRTILSLLFALAAVSGSPAATWDLGKNGISVTVVAEPDTVDPARDFFVTVTATAEIPDLRDRFRGFEVAEDYPETPVENADGTKTHCSRWRLVPEPCAKSYSLRPFVVADFHTVPVRFAPPAKREPVTGEMETNPKKDFPPLSWRLVRLLAAWTMAIALAAFLVAALVKKIAQTVKIHRMSPIQRAWWELERLLEKGLPGRGHFKDFYVELTMVVRRYVERKYGVKAPNMTTEEFIRTAKPSDELRRFLEAADLVKFAGVEATPAMADAATDSARAYFRKDSEHDKIH